MLTVAISIEDAEKTLAAEGFFRYTMKPRPEPPLPRNRAFGDPLSKVRAVTLSPSIALLKRVRLETPPYPGAVCCDCDWPRLRAVARANLRADADKNFTCCDMLCTRTKNSFFRVHRIISPNPVRPVAVQVVVPKEEGYKPDEFDFSDWDAIKRSTGF